MLHLNIFMIQSLCTVMQPFKGSYFTWMLIQDISDLIRLSRTVQRTYFIIMSSVSPASRKGIKDHILQSSSTKLIIGTDLDMDFNSKVCGL